MTDNPLVPSATATLFPKGYLLSIYTAAIEQGFIWITPLQQAQAASLRGKLHRLRRRSDTSNKTFITSQHHLVSFGEWQPGPDGNGRMAAVYDSRSSDDLPLPGFTRGDGTPVDHPAFAIEPPTNDFAPSLPPELAEAASAPLSAESIDDFVSRMQRSAEAREDDDDEQ